MYMTIFMLVFNIFIRIKHKKGNFNRKYIVEYLLILNIPTRNYFQLESV